MTKLREQMIHEMVLRGLAPNTQRTYLQAVSQLARHYGRSPDAISKREVKAYLLYLHQGAKRSTSTCNVAAAAMRFLYHQTLGRSAAGFDIPFARRPKKLPQVLSRQEVARLLSGTRFLRHRVLVPRIGSLPYHLSCLPSCVRTGAASSRGSFCFPPRRTRALCVPVR